ncbi:MAG: alpha/beta fold hydrolase [Chloroflexota bacterium]|nr:MAG: alpha/beta fold hydrolase [Chloroflexota bacterium]
MPFAVNQGVCIYYEVEGHGPPLVLHHGIAMSLEFWRYYGYVEALKKSHQLILIDARGHGASDKPCDPAAYHMDLMVGDVLAVLDELEIATAHYWGFSMGAVVGFQIARHDLTRLHSFTVGGMSPYVTQLEKRYSARVAQLLGMGLQVFVDLLEEASGTMSHEAKALMLDNDLQALRAASSAFDQWPGAADILSTITIPCLVYAGEADYYRSGARECAKHMPNATFVPLPKLSHALSFTRGDLVLPHVTQFLAGISQREERIS